MALTSDDLCWFSQLAVTLHAQVDERPLFGDLTRALHARFRPIVTVVEEAAYTLASYRLHSGIVPVTLPADYTVAFDASPLVVQWKASRASETMHLSRCVSREAFRRTTFFNVIGKPFGLEDQLIGTFGAGPDVALNFSVNRDSCFSDGERAPVEQVRRHVQACVWRLRRSRPKGPARPCWKSGSTRSYNRSKFRPR